MYIYMCTCVYTYIRIAVPVHYRADSNKCTFRLAVEIDILNYTCRI